MTIHKAQIEGLAVADFSAQIAAVPIADQYITLNKGEISNPLSTPAVQNVSPASMSTITPTQPITFEVLGADTRILISVEFPGLVLTELVHDGDSFTPAYAATSSRTAIAGGFRYTLLRSPQWPDQIVPRIYAFSGVEL